MCVWGGGRERVCDRREACVCGGGGERESVCA